LKIRTTFTIWIALASFSTALIFSAFVYIELIEEPEKLFKREIFDVKDAIFESISTTEEVSFAPEDTDYPLERYYIKLTNGDGRIVYFSQIASHMDIPAQPVDGFFSVTRPLPLEHLWKDPVDDDDYDEIDGSRVRFSAFQETRKIGGATILLVVAKPLALFSVELRDLLGELLVSILLATLLVIFLSFFLAGRLLAPLSRINAKIQTIREHSLNERIPLAESRDELYVLSKSLNTMFDRLQFSFDRQRDFLSSAAHELKIPLTIIMLSQEEILVKESADDLKSELQRQLISLQRLNRLVKDLLDISHLEHKDTIEKQSVLLPESITGVLEDLDDLLKAKGIQCSTKIGQLWVFADHDRLVRVFINLIDNAIKYNLPSGGQIEIEAQGLKNMASITISNTGEEIPATDLPHVFSQFYRVEKSRSHRYGGTGLGLTIVKRIVELHNGTIWIESDSNRTRITLTLPLAL